MTQYLPVSGSAQSFIAHLQQVKHELQLESADLFTQISSNEIPLPTELNQLDRETVDIIDLSVDTALALRIPFGSFENKMSRRVLIQEYKKYKEVSKGAEIIHYGISIRWIVNIRKLNLAADISSLPMVTASAQLNSISATVRFEVVGISSAEITSLLPSNVDLKADTYVSLKNSFEKIKSKIWDKNTTITPTILGVYGTIKSEEDRVYNDAVIITYALHKIKEGKTLQRALSDQPNLPHTAQDIIQTVYTDINHSSDLTSTVSSDAKDRAKSLLKMK